VQEGLAVERFIHEQNLSLYRRLLTEEKDMKDERRQLILKLLADEEAKDRGSEAASVGKFPHAS
jgi:hypothetical protein